MKRSRFRLRALPYGKTCGAMEGSVQCEAAIAAFSEPFSGFPRLIYPESILI